MMHSTALPLLAALLVPGDDAPGDRASFEQPLPPGALVRLGSTRFRHASPVDRMEVSPDGETLVTATKDARCSRFEAATGRLLCRSEPLPGTINRLAFGADGSILASVLEHGLVSLDENLAAGEPRFAEDRPSVVVPLPGGGSVVVDTAGTSLQIRDAGGEKEFEHSVAGLGGYTDAAASADGKRVLLLANERESRRVFHGLVFVVSRAASRVIAAGRLEGTALLCAAMTPDGSRALVGGLDGSVHLFDVAAEEFSASATEHAGRTTSVCFSPDGRVAASGSNDGTLVLMDGETLERERVIEAHRGIVAAIRFSPDGETVYTGGQDGRVRAFATATGEDRMPVDGHGGPITAACWIPGTDSLLTGGSDGYVIRWNRDGALEASFRANLGAVYAIAVTQDGAYAAFAGQDGRTQLVDLTAGEVVFEVQETDRAAMDVAFSPEGDRLLVGSADGRARVWSAESGELLLSLDSGAQQVNSVAWSPDGRTLAVGTSIIRLFEAEDGYLLRDFDGPKAPVLGLAYTPLGDRLISASADRRIRSWNPDTGDLVFSIPGHRGRPEMVSVSSDGRLAASCSYGDRAALLFDIQAGKLVRRIETPEGEVTAVAISADGAFVATGGTDANALIWRL